MQSPCSDLEGNSSASAAASRVSHRMHKARAADGRRSHAAAVIDSWQSSGPAFHRKGQTLNRLFSLERDMAMGRDQHSASRS